MKIGVIGAGVVGTLVARELSRYNADIYMFEREADVSFGVTKANSGVIHGCFHETPGTKRAKYCVRGNTLYDTLSRKLDFPFVRVGAHVLALTHDDEETLLRLRSQGQAIGAPGLSILSPDKVLAHEPQVNPDIKAALWSPTVGIVEPWAVAIAAVENAVENGLHLHLKTQVEAICIQDGRVSGVNTNQGSFPLDAVVNAAGLYAGAVAQMAGIGEPRIHPRRGDYILLDKQAAFVVNSVLFPAPVMNSKGILVLPTIEGNLLLGPTAVDLPALDDRVTETSEAGLAEVIAGARRIVPRIDIGHTIKTFAGARPEPETGEFVVGRTHVDGFYQAAGMRSPGLTAAPAIAKHLAQQISSDLGLDENESFNPVRHADPRFSRLSPERRSALIRKDPSYGRIVCRCNEVTEGEIVTAIRKGARTLDGIKFRTRAGFGPCQGGFCTARILAIMSRELGIPYEQITVRGSNDPVVVGRVRP